MSEWLVTAAVFVIAIGGCWWFLHRTKKKDETTPPMRLVSVITLGLAIASTFQIVWFQVQRDREQQKRDHFTECQARINTAILDTLKDRSGANSDADSALLDYANAALNAKTDKEVRDATQRFIDALNAKKAAQRDNPYPEVPKDCRP